MQGLWKGGSANQTRFAQAHTPPKVSKKRQFDSTNSNISHPSKKQKISQQQSRSKFTLQTQSNSDLMCMNFVFWKLIFLGKRL